MRIKLILALLFFLGFSHLIVKSESRNNRFNFGVKLGGGISSFTDPLTINGLTNVSGSVNGGLAFQIPITQNLFSLQSEITYNIRVFKDENSDFGDHNYLINTIEFPVMLNTRLFKYMGHKHEMGVNLITGFGLSKGIKSRILTDSERLINDFGYWVEYEYVQLNDAFEDIRKDNTLLILGLNIQSLYNSDGLIGLRYTRFLNSIYAFNKVTENYDFTTKAYCISLELTFYF